MTTATQVTGIPQWTLADRCRKAREHAGMDQRQLADAIGVARNTVVNYEHGHRQPREIVLRAWAMATGVPLEWLKSGTVDTRQYPHSGLLALAA